MDLARLPVISELSGCWGKYWQVTEKQTDNNDGRNPIFLYVFEWNRRSDTYQDVNQQQVLWAPALVAKKVFHAEFGRIRCETAAVPVQPVVDLRQRGKTQKLSSFATDEARANK